MPEVIFPGPEGRLEGRFNPGPRPRAPVAMILHSHPQAGGTMNNKIVQLLYKTFVRRGFATLRFNFRGVGKSQGTFDNGIGELSDAASALDWVQQIHPEAETTWVAGVSFGAWICWTQSSALAASLSSPIPLSNVPWLLPTPRKLKRSVAKPRRTKVL